MKKIVIRGKAVPVTQKAGTIWAQAQKDVASTIFGKRPKPGKVWAEAKYAHGEVKVWTPEEVLEENIRRGLI